MKLKWSIQIGLVILLASCGSSKDTEPQHMTVAEERVEKDAEFRDPETSPLQGLEAIAAFDGLEYYSIDSTYMVKARAIYTPDTEPFTMAMTKERENHYRQYATLHFTLHDTMLTLNLYRNLDLAKKEEYKDYFFLPFKDRTNGNATYGGGRYLDLRFLNDPDTVTIDFNRAYNPYCVYNYKYSCPIPPEPNHLPIAIEAGEKNYVAPH